MQKRCQQTLAAAFERSGRGLHSGVVTRVRVLPSPPQRGRYFVRTDLTDTEIPAAIAAVSQTMLSTELSQAEATVRTVEHLLAALAGMNIDNARIEIDGPELPLLDGSAQEWVRAIATAGTLLQAVPLTGRSLLAPVHVQQGDAFVSALPAPAPRFTYGIDFDLAAIGNQWHSWSPAEGNFAEAIAPARTFGLADQIEYLRAQGLIKGGSLENALVCDRSGWLNPPLRFANEPARHKLLDLLGDLSLLGVWPDAHIVAYKASHQLHVQLAAKLSCQLVTSKDDVQVGES
ncbi:MAG: UDP-3-O-acyl-N-acetylglucosamine deacetylase [Leptolyngbyaceae cyanobacterium SM1_1_3]|nr:UDP-3-O-acyl-N-acetylglucosamine deacetylase [Leptolyngbyaceae cyanobacterium SM1_1_3]NJN01708.1 UDP-3-O-acyl-N-acetylglucosamine deacetylase [Leptolyngbyaceae cyanobacterium RM1_1_2]NJO09368.1 UDP-3-O-acyl-N-acetylglucosamine deacetylase [Leptolyngbyaceae cyanobacterium SL_1_1]